MDPKPTASPSTSPNSSSSSSSSSNKDSPPSNPPTPKSTLTNNTTTVNNSYPTTFIQANTQSFKQVVQMLTGAPESATKKSPTNPIRPISKPTKNNKLYERRNSMKNLKLISPLIPSFTNSSREEVISPSVLNFPSLILSSPVHRSPRGGEMPKLLPLFPLTSPRMESARDTTI